MVVVNLLHTLAFPLYLIAIEKAEEFQFPPLLPDYDFSNAIVIAKPSTNQKNLFLTP